MKSFRRLFVIIFINLLILNNGFAAGLRFNGSEHLIDERTSYDVFCGKSPHFSGKLNINFDISLLEPSHFGYIVRLKNNEADKIYNLSYYIDGETTLFKFNEEGGKNLITAKLRNQELQKLHWFNISIAFDMKKHTLDLSINGHIFTISNIVLPKTWKPDICFGRSEYLIDVPSFAIKQLSISDNRQEILFPLEESRGNVAHNSQKEPFGKINNPIWLINDVYHWSHRSSFKSNSIAGYNFDNQTDNLYIFNRDSLFTYNVRTGNKTREAFRDKCPLDIFLGTNFLDSKEQKLYVYEVCNEKHDQGPSIAVLNLQTKTWSVVSQDFLYMQLHHHSTYYNESTKRYFIFGGFGGFGGFGNMQYSKSLFSFDLNTNKWDSLKLKGDKINPRYFSSLGYSKKNNALYVFGGMGNESGEQIVGRKYYYDLHKINLNNNTVSKVWEIPWAKENMVPARDMVVQNDSCFYTLCYPEHFSKTFLKLYSFSLKDGSYKILGDSIPIRSDKIKTNVNLYYSTNDNALLAIVQEFDNYDISSNIKVYSISYPPITYEELINHGIYSKHHSGMILLAVFLVILFIGITVYLYLKKNKKTHTREEFVNIETDDNTLTQPAEAGEKITLKQNGIYLFGEFRIQDRKNKDITYMLSSKLKQTFLIILQFSAKNGISSQHLSELLWPDKPEDKVKNSRGVTINRLRQIMKELDGIELIYDKGLFRIKIDSKLCYCDYLRCLELIDTNSVENNLTEFTEIVKQGKFLRSINLPEFDSFKEDLEKKLEPALLVEAEKSHRNNNLSLTQTLCDAIFNIDPINDEAIFFVTQALVKMRMNNEAKKRFFVFTNEYKKMMGKEYPITFSELSTGKKRH